MEKREKKGQNQTPSGHVVLMKVMEDGSVRTGEADFKNIPNGPHFVVTHFEWKGWSAPGSQLKVTVDGESFVCGVADKSGFERLSPTRKHIVRGILIAFHARAGRIVGVPENGPVPLPLGPDQRCRPEMR